MSNKWKLKGFTILELLVVVAIVAILAVISIPNFIGRIDEAKASQELAEIDAVGKAISTYYVDNGVYPTLQGKDGTLLQPQPLDGAPHNVDFSSLVPNYLATLPHFSYWWVDAQGKVYHTQNTIGSVTGSVFTPQAGYTYTLYKTNGTTQVLSGTYTLLAGEYIIGKDANNVVFPKISSVFKNAKVHPESGDTPVAVVTFTTATFTNAGATGQYGPTQTQLDSAYAGTVLEGKVTSSAGIQLWTVPLTGTYRIETYGGAGGGAGKGAIMLGNFSLSKGDILRMLVGQQGISQAGGGGTFVTKVNNDSTYKMFDGIGVTPLIVSGGGGYGSNASITTSGVSGFSGGVGGQTGNGGRLVYVSGNKGGLGGGGFITAGEDTGGTSFLNGGNGANSVSGFGGGAPDAFIYISPYYYYPSGAGGGYSGGGGGGANYGSGGGGGSYNSGTAQTNTVGNVGMGKVIITYVGP